MQNDGETRVPVPMADQAMTEGMTLLSGLRGQLAEADLLGFDLVAIRIAEAIDQLVEELGIALPENARLQ